MVNLYTLSLEIAHECNLNCRYCYLGAKKNKVMNSNMAKEAVDMSIFPGRMLQDTSAITGNTDTSRKMETF